MRNPMTVMIRSGLKFGRWRSADGVGGCGSVGVCVPVLGGTTTPLTLMAAWSWPMTGR